MSINEEYKVLTLWEPWATLHALGIKKFETRPKPTSWRGTYLIHSAKRWTREQTDFINSEFLRHLMTIHNISPRLFKNNLGCIIGRVNYLDCVQIPGGRPFVHTVNGIDVALPPRETNDEFWLGDYTKGRYIWLGVNHCLTLPFPYRGSQGYYAKFKGDIRELMRLQYDT